MDNMQKGFQKAQLNTQLPPQKKGMSWDEIRDTFISC